MKWHFIVKRKYCLLWADLAIGGYSRKYFCQAVGYDQEYKNLQYINWDWSVSEEEFNREIKLTRKLLNRNPEFFLQVPKRCYKFGDDLIRFSKSLLQLPLQRLKENELLKVFLKFTDKFRKVAAFLQHSHATSKNLEDIIRENLDSILMRKGRKNLFDYYLSILTSPLKINIPNKAEEDLLKIAVRFQKHKNKFLLEKEIQKYIFNYGWIRARDGISKPLGAAEVRRGVLKIKNPRQKLLELENQRRKNLKEFRRIIKELNFSKKLHFFINLAKEYVYLRTYRTDVLAEANFRARPLWREMGKRYDLNFKQVSFLTVDEILNFKNKPVPKKIINERAKEYACVILNDKKRVYSGQQLFLEKKIVQKKVPKSKQIPGTIANSGRVRGRVCIVLNVQEIKKIKNGNILVSSMTTPDFLPAMKKAAAFVTDEGGITCHAAIVSREMKKPCIIGTRIATKVLKDGDWVEVDANKGIVIKLNKI